MQAALDGEVEPRPMEGSVADVIQKWIAPVRPSLPPSPSPSPSQLTLLFRV